MTSPRELLDIAPMSPAQVLAVGLTFVLSALDGYDVMSVAFAAPAITAGWGIGKAALGVVLAAGLGGMALGSFLLAPLADIIGRKAIVLVSLVLMALGMLACSFSDGVAQMTVWRAVTGVGIGACISVINPLAAEFANARNRALTVAIMAIGYPVGGVSGGLLATWLLATHGWQAVFLAGFVAAAVLLPVIGLFLPESPAWLLTRRGPHTLARVNAVLTKFRQPPIERLPECRTTAKRGYAALFVGKTRGTTVWLTIVNLLFVMTVYYVLSWLPQLVADAGFDASDSSRVSAVSSLAGVAGGVLLGLAAKRLDLRFLAAGAIGGLAVSAFAFGLVPPSYTLLMVTGVICGFFLFGAGAGFYATLATSFGDEVRASGSGFVIGVGRISSALAPLIAGWLFASGLDRAEVTGAFAALSLLSAAVLLFGWERFRSQ